ncbi:hypothetical protein G7046_g8363 [Stylonectria norvegica]|nr:hypothetical protein G7046_g8363 [Stylonectria norvegica]
MPRELAPRLLRAEIEHMHSDSDFRTIRSKQVKSPGADGAAGTTVTDASYRKVRRTLHDLGRPSVLCWEKGGIALIRCHRPAPYHSFPPMHEHIKNVAEALQGYFSLSKPPRCLDVKTRVPWHPPNHESWTGKKGDLGGTRIYEYVDPNPESVARFDIHEADADNLMRRYYAGPVVEEESSRNVWQLVEVCHPAIQHITKYPFAVCDPFTINFHGDVQPAWVNTRINDRPSTKQGYLYAANTHKWYYLPNQTPCELLVRKVGGFRSNQRRGTKPNIPPMATPNITEHPDITSEWVIRMRYEMWVSKDWQEVKDGGSYSTAEAMDGKDVHKDSEIHNITSIVNVGEMGAPGVGIFGLDCADPPPDTIRPSMFPLRNEQN